MASTAPGAHPVRRAPVRLPHDAKPMLSIVVDCEEGFDWSRPLHGTPHDLVATTGLARLAAWARRSGVTLTCMATYPVLTDDEAWRRLDTLLAQGDAVLGAHLHPWVTPPFGEAVTIANSFQGNLEPAQEAAKIATMAEAVRARTGQAPRLFKAGRSGFGPATAGALIGHGFQTDLSFMPGFTYAAQGGPSFLAEQPGPFRFVSGAGTLLEVPDTGGFLGVARAFGHRLHPRVDTPFLRGLRVPGLLVRAGILNRVPLTPEGVTEAEAEALTLLLHAGGQRVFQLSFHSTSLVPGGTSYVPDEAAVERLFTWLTGYVQFFRARLQGEVVTPLQIADAIHAEVTA